MEFWLLALISLLLAAVAFIGYGRAGRGFFFTLFWTVGLLCILFAIFLYLSVPLFDQDLQAFPYYKIALIIGLAAFLGSLIAALLGARISIYSQLAEERQQRAIGEITQVAVSSSSLMELLNFTLDKIVTMLNMAGGAIHVFHRAKQNLVLGSYKGLSARLARRLETIDLGENAIGRCAKNKRLLIIRNLRLSPDYDVFGGKSEAFSNMALIPVVSEGEHWGVITLFGRGTYRPGMLQVDLLEQFGEQLGTALVLGRMMRSAQSSLGIMKSLITALGDELYAVSRLGRGGPGVVRAIAWSLTRNLNGDRFDLCRISDSGWATVISSDPGADGRLLNVNPESEFVEPSRPSGMIGWDQAAPFDEFIERRPYVFCALPDKQTWMFIRLESRRRAAVDFDFFYDACRIIFGLLRVFAPEGTALSAVEKRKGNVLETAGLKRSDEGSAIGKISDSFGKISHDLEKLIDEYSSAEDRHVEGIIKWLEVIRKSVAEGRDLALSMKESDRKKRESASNDLESIISNALERVSNSSAVAPNIEYSGPKRKITVRYRPDKLAEITSRFLELAADSAGADGTLTLTSTKSKNSVMLELKGENIPAPGSPKPAWIDEAGAKLEYSSETGDDGRSIDRWRLIVPETGSHQTEKERRKVLAVDTRDIIRDLLSGMLTQLGCDPVVVASSSEAVRHFEKGIESGDRFEVVIADNAIDELSGLRMASRMKAADPGLFFLLTPGWGMEPDAGIAKKSGVDLVLEKPFSIEQLAEALEGAGRRAVGK